MSEPRIAAVTLVRNEQHILPTCLGHLLDTLGVSHVFAADDGSGDRTGEILAAVAAGTGRLSFERRTDGFRQDLVLTDLARLAAAEGFDWVLPVDADEFLWLPPGLRLPAVLSDASGGGFRLPVRNFVQHRAVRRDGPNALATMAAAAEPVGTVADGRPLVEAGRLPFLNIRYPSKLLLRATPELSLAFGHHDATGTAGPLLPLPGAEVLHAPIRSRDDLPSRAEAGRRMAEVVADPDLGWHLRRLASAGDGVLDAEWRANSYRLTSWPAGLLCPDGRLARIWWRQRGFRRRFG